MLFLITLTLLFTDPLEARIRTLSICCTDDTAMLLLIILTFLLTDLLQALPRTLGICCAVDVAINMHLPAAHRCASDPSC